MSNPEVLTISHAQYEVYYQDFSKLDDASEGALGTVAIEQLLQNQLQRRATELEISLFMAEFEESGAIGFREYMSVVLGSDWQLEGLSGMEASLMYHSRHESFDLIVDAVDGNRDGTVQLAELTDFLVKLQEVLGEPEQPVTVVEAHAQPLLHKYGNGVSMAAEHLRTLLISVVTELAATQFHKLLKRCKQKLHKNDESTTDKLHESTQHTHSQQTHNYKGLEDVVTISAEPCTSDDREGSSLCSRLPSHNRCAESRRSSIGTASH